MKYIKQEERGLMQDRTSWTWADEVTGELDTTVDHLRDGLILCKGQSQCSDCCAGLGWNTVSNWWPFHICVEFVAGFVSWISGRRDEEDKRQDRGLLKMVRFMDHSWDTYCSVEFPFLSNCVVLGMRMGGRIEGLYLVFSTRLKNAYHDGVERI